MPLGRLDEKARRKREEYFDALDKAAKGDSDPLKHVVYIGDWSQALLEGRIERDGLRVLSGMDTREINGQTQYVVSVRGWNP